MGVRTLLLLAKLLFVDLASPDEGPPEGQAFVFLGHADKASAVDEHQLLDAVAIYTRDLGVALLQSPGKQPASLTPTALDDVAALLRARGARLGFWCQPAPGGRQIELVTVDPRRSVGRFSFDPESSSRSDLYRSIALRLRAILVGVEPGDTGPNTSASAAPPSSAPAMPLTPPPQAVAAPVTRPPPPEDQRPAERAAPSRSVARNGVSDEWPRMFFGAGYALSYPLGTSLAAGATARNALALDVMVATHGQFEWDFGTDLAPSSDRTSAVASISVMDIPLRFGGRWVHMAGPVTVATGPFAALHWLSANASAPMQTDQRTAFGGAGGADLVVRGPGFAGFAPQVRVWAEVNVPRTRFTIQGVPNYDVGALRLGLNVEIVAPVPQ